MSYKNTHSYGALAIAILILCGCATAPKTLYQWETYQDQVYEYYKGQSPDRQIEAMERDLQKIYAQGNTAPPGFLAHLGLVYAEAGNDSKAIENLTAERNKFPESAEYIDFLLKKYNK